MEPIIISLTTIKKRYDDLTLLKTLDNLVNLNGNYKIVLNISSQKFLLDDGFTADDIKSLQYRYPQILINIVENFGSLRKIIPTLKLFRNHLILTVDDDVIYDKNMLKRFCSAYKKHNCIISSVCRYINITKKGTVLKFKRITRRVNPLMDALAEGVGGILYNSSWFSDSFINFDFKKLSNEILTNDDLLLRAYLYLKNINVYKISLPICDSQPKHGLFNRYNKKYKINFKKFFDVVRNIE